MLDLLLESLLPIPPAISLLAAIGLAVGGTLLVISRRSLTPVESIALLLLVWVVPVIGVASAMSYLWLDGRRRR